MIALIKTLDPRDWDELVPELVLVDAVGIGEQHPMRRWEYAMALRALSEHRKGYVSPLAGYLVLDVGGAGSPFAEICQSTQASCQIVDPKLNVAIEAIGGVPLADAVISISTIEHVKEPLPFLEACHRALAPGGLLFLTADYWDRWGGPDTAHFHWMRERIYNPMKWGVLAGEASTLGFRMFGGYDMIYGGNHVYDYTFASLALTKEA